MKKPIVILRAGDAAPAVAARRGQFAEWIVRVAGPEWAGNWSTHDVRTEEVLPAVSGAAGFVITGSSSSVTERAPWMLRLEAFVRDVAEAKVPLFGICFGHQIVAQALGGEVILNPRGREIGTVRVRRLRQDAMFAAAPPEFDVNATHKDCVSQLPEGARLLAASELDPVQAFAIGETIRCVQFHPEMDGDAMRGYVEARAHLIEEEGGDAKAILRGVTDAPDAEAILATWVRMFVKAQGGWRSAGSTSMSSEPPSRP